METFSALLAICEGNSPVTGEFPTQRPVTRSFDVYFDLRPNKRLSKQSWGWWFETLSCPLWRHRNECDKICRYMSHTNIPIIDHITTTKQSTAKPCAYFHGHIELIFVHVGMLFNAKEIPVSILDRPVEIFDEFSIVVSNSRQSKDK